MSTVGEGALVVVGTTDHWSAVNRGPLIAYDSRLLAARNTGAASNPDSIVSANTRTARAGGWYAEMVAVAVTSGAWAAGVILASLVNSTLLATAIHTAADGVTYGSDGVIRKNGGTVQSGLTTLSAGSVLGVKLYDVSGTSRVQFYVNGTATGSAVTMAAGAYNLGWTGYTSSNSIYLRVDGNDLASLPADAQPWGAAARVADCGGYTPAASLIAANGNNITVDTYKRTASDTSGVDTTGDSARTDIAGRAGALRYVEFVLEATSGLAGLVGLAGTSYSMDSQYIGAVPGDAFGWYGVDGRVFRNGGTVTTLASWTTNDRLGVIFDASTGSVWFVKNGAVQAGDPEAGTGGTITGLTGDWYPAATPYGAAARIRFCTHAREQVYRPSYATAWDGADALPEQHHPDRLYASPTVRRAISFVPWAARSNRGAPIGAVDINNADGDYDLVGAGDLRDEDCIAYRRTTTGLLRREWTGVVESCVDPSPETWRVLVADRSAPLDQHVASPVFTLGKPELIPVHSRIGSTISYDVAQSTFAGFSVYDKGVLVNSWTRSDANGVAGFTRTVNPAGLQSVRDFELVRQDAQVTVTNGDFSSWGGGVPSNWTYFEDDATGSVVQSGTRAVLTAGVAGDAGLFHAATITNGNTYAFKVKIDAISGLSAGNIGFVFENTAGAYLVGPSYQAIGPNIAETGVLVIVATATSNWSGFSIYTSFGASMTVDYVELYQVTQTTDADDAIAYLMESEGGFSAAEWEYSAPISPYSPGRVGFWSKDRPTIRAVLGEVCDSLLVDYYTDRDGVIRFAWLTPPEEVTSNQSIYLGAIAEHEVFGDLTREDDYSPNLSTRAEYQRNYEQHTDDDIAGSVSASDRQYFTSERKENQLVITGAGSPASEAGRLHPFYSFAEEAPAMPRVLVNDFVTEDTPSDGSTTIDNRLICLHRCYMVRRKFYRFAISRDKTDSLGVDPGGVVQLTHSRYGLSAGKKLLVATVETNLTSPVTNLVCWG